MTKVHQNKQTLMTKTHPITDKSTPLNKYTDRKMG